MDLDLELLKTLRVISRTWTSATEFHSAFKAFVDHAYDEFVTRDVLINELPDPKPQLFYQWRRPTTFPSFQRLPAELRIIWKFALLGGSRTLPIRIKGVWYRALQRFRAQIPTLLAVNIESRTEALKQYSKPYNYGFNQPWAHELEPQAALHRNYFNPNIDTVSCDDLKGFQLLVESLNLTFTSLVWDDLKTIKHLEIRRPNWRFIFNRSRSNFGALMSSHNETFINDWADMFLFNGLETLTIVGGGPGLRNLFYAPRIVEVFRSFFLAKKIRYERKESTENCTIPEVKIRMPCHPLGVK